MSHPEKAPTKAGWLHLGSTGILVIVFVYAFALKVADPGVFVSALSQSLQVGSWMWLVSIVFVPPMELLAVLAILLPHSRRWGLYLCGLLLIGFSLFLLSNQMRGIHADCGCFGAGNIEGSFWRSNVGGVVRNAVLLLLVFFALSGCRPLRSTRGGTVIGNEAVRRTLAVRGFTLVELLVVIGIIGILMTLALSMAGRSRESARSLVCKNNLRSVITDALLMASSRDGFLPLSGRIRLAAVGSPVSERSDRLPELLSDPLRQRYRYYRASSGDQANLPFGDGLIPFVLAVSGADFDQPGVRDSFPGLTQSLEQYVRMTPEAARLVCPSGRPGEDIASEFPLDYAIAYDTGQLITPDLCWVPRSYAVNASLLSFDRGHPHARWSLRGKLAAIGGPAVNYVVIAEGDGHGVNFSIRPGYDGPSVSLSDVDLKSPEIFDPARRSPGLARTRHRAGLNAAFADGSVRSLRSEVDLQQSILVYGR